MAGLMVTSMLEQMDECEEMLPNSLPEQLHVMEQRATTDISPTFLKLKVELLISHSFQTFHILVCSVRSEKVPGPINT